MTGSENEKYVPALPFWKRLSGHFMTVIAHKWSAFKWCCKLGIPWQGLVHDNSKLLPVEFWEGVKYFQGGSSPIPACKKWNNGYSRAWQHHRRALHHYEAWTDSYDSGVIAHVMPYKYALELVADSLAAGEAYAKNRREKFTPADELAWWVSNSPKKHAMHPTTKRFVTEALVDIVKKDEVHMSYREIRADLKGKYEALAVDSSYGTKPFEIWRTYKI